MYSDCICYMNKKLENKRKSKENKKYGKNRVIFYKCLHFKNYDLPDAFFDMFKNCDLPVVFITLFIF